MRGAQMKGLRDFLIVFFFCTFIQMWVTWITIGILIFGGHIH
jgi:hypothetical protein